MIALSRDDAFLGKLRVMGEPDAEQGVLLHVK